VSAESGDKGLDGAKAGHPVERRLNRIERVTAVYHGQLDQRFADSMLVSFNSADEAVLGACEMQHRCSVLPQILRRKLALCIGVHQGLIRQRSQDVTDGAPETAAQLARINDGILISREVVEGLSGDLRLFIQSFDETITGMGVYTIDWREIPSGPHGVESLRPPPSPVPRKGPCLQLHLGLKTLEISEHKPVVTLGRDPANDLVVADSHVSRNHCRVERTDKGILLIDSSVNGTIVVGEDKQEMLIKNGSAALTGSGMIFLGRPFMGERRGGVRYESL
jgi:DNA-binding transcriptional regulator YdaS (Cro superfamily)